MIEFLKDALWDMFNGNFWGGFLCLLFFWAVFALFLVLLYIGWDCYQWGQVKPFPHKAKLVSLSNFNSTLQTNAVPVVTADGNVGVGVVTTGNPESLTTIWDCGEYGRLKTEDREVFRWAKPEAVLLLKKRGDQVQIAGIQR